MQFSESDVLFLVETVLPERDDKARVVSLVRDDPDFVEALLGDERVFQRMVRDEEILLHVSPHLFFSVLLKQARQDLEAESYTMERRQRQRVAIFDAPQAAKLLADRPLRDYLAGMLASFTRVHGFTQRVRVRRGVWRKQRFNDLDLESLIRYASALEAEQRFLVYKRIGDVCLFLAGMFPEYIEGRSRQPAGHAPRLARGRLAQSIEDYEREGRRFYGLAAGHHTARAAELAAPLAALADNFTLAEKPLSFIASHYLAMRKHTLFDVSGSASSPIGGAGPE